MGDAGYHKHPITAFGITDAFRDAEAVASALDDAFAERRPFDDAMADYQRARDEEALPIYEFTCDFAKLEPPPPEMQQLIGAMQGNQEAHGRLRERHGRHAAGARVLRARERRAHHGRRRAPQPG